MYSSSCGILPFGLWLWALGVPEKSWHTFGFTVTGANALGRCRYGDRNRAGQSREPKAQRLGRVISIKRVSVCSVTPRWTLCFVLSVSSASGACRGTNTPPPATRPDIVLVTIDTLRADRVRRDLMPTVDALGSRGVRF